MESHIIRDATAGDISAIQQIYAYYVENTVITFEEVIPDIEEMHDRFLTIKDHGMPYIVAEQDGHVVGYAYASVFRTRRAFRFCAEHSVYLDPSCRGKGIGFSLMQALIKACEPTGIRQMVACISDKKDGASIALHKKCGFKHIGVLPASGYKFDRWIDMTVMQRQIGEGDNTAPDGIGLNLT